MNRKNLSKYAEVLEEDDPEEEGHAGQTRGDDDGIARQFGIAAELLRHGERSDGAGRGEDAEESDEFNAPEAQEHGRAQNESGDDQQAPGHGENQVAYVVA